MVMSLLSILCIDRSHFNRADFFAVNRMKKILSFSVHNERIEFHLPWLIVKFKFLHNGGSKNMFKEESIPVGRMLTMQ